MPTAEFILWFLACLACLVGIPWVMAWAAEVVAAWWARRRR